MRRLVSRLIRLCWILIVAFLCVGIIASVTGVITPADAQPAPRQNTVTLNGMVYLSRTTLQQRFQASIDQQLPKLKDTAIKNIVSGLPGWAGEFANSLIQPSIKLLALTPQQAGLRADLQLSLYDGDPDPTAISMLVTFQVLNSNTVQVSGEPISGQPTLISGPITTITLPIGQITSVTPTPTCGDAGLQVGLQLPVNLAANATKAQSNTSATYAPLSLSSSQREQRSQTQQDSVAANIEIPVSSLSTLAQGLGTITINTSLQAQNLQITEQNGTYSASADIIGNVFGNPTLKLGTATTILAPSAVNGQLQMNVTNTNVHILFLTLPVNDYNQQIQQSLNTAINSALKNQVYINSVSVGPNAQIPCATPNSLLLSGTAPLN